mmetsp:Transcript_10808/g.14027  ORF Transcript_10808/g.14027 Transcript_10808/m.14027 type:complete len:440 (-) Transcript_10808:312-1631(-)
MNFACWTITAVVILMESTSVDGLATKVLPRAPTPPYILSNVPGTWAYDTMSRRVREEIIGRIFEENDLDAPDKAEAKAKMEALREELTEPQNHKLRYIEEDGGPDIEAWREILTPYTECNWLDAPWCVTEFYLYRRIMEAFAYFKTSYDPFESQKQAGLTSSLASIEGLAEKLSSSNSLSLEAGLLLYISTSLWGNRMDLSLWPVGEAVQDDIFAQVLAAGSKNLLADDSEEMIEQIKSCIAGQSKRVDIVVDNAGFELICDLCLADYLVSSGVAEKVVFQLKAHPTFVSDAMSKDMMWMIDTMAELDDEKYPFCKSTGLKWQSLVAEGKWELKENFFWVQPQPFWDIPEDLRSELGESSIVFVKGDANYRRLLGDRYWPLSTPFTDVANYFPTRLCALRTLKAELGCGLLDDKVKEASEKDDKWMVSGRWGVIQFYNP